MSPDTCVHKASGTRCPSAKHACAKMVRRSDAKAVLAFQTSPKVKGQLFRGWCVRVGGGEVEITVMMNSKQTRRKNKFWWENSTARLVTAMREEAMSLENGTRQMWSLFPAPRPTVQATVDKRALLPLLLSGRHCGRLLLSRSEKKCELLADNSDDFRRAPHPLGISAHHPIAANRTTEGRR